MNKTKNKNVKPIDYDAHFKYRCPEVNCNFDHWLSLKEAQTKNFKVVCDCGYVFSPKRIKKIKVSYTKEIVVTSNKPLESSKNIPINIPIDLLDKSSEALVKYGFTKTEAKDLIKKAFIENPTADTVQLIKIALTKVGET
jgi:Holliday junction resolvasome RuvABC DNA-binding subunit